MKRQVPKFWFLLIFTLIALLPTGDATADEVRLPNNSGRLDVGAPPARAAWRRLDVAPEVRLFVLPGTAADRDAERIAAEVRQSLRRVQGRLGIEATPVLEVYLVERVFWQGGAAYENGRILITYSDRNYTTIPLRAYLDHEITHALSQTFVPEGGETNALLSEGLATWTTGGHYGPDPIHEIATALARSRAYVPLARLVTDFRAAQHETAYIEAASFVGWLIERWGMETFKRLYGNAAVPHIVLGRTYADLEREWLRWLSGRPVSPFTVRWFGLRIRAFETMRQYQETFDSFARQLPDSPVKWNADLTNQYRDNPDAPVNVALETLLKALQEDIRCGRLIAADRRLEELQASILANDIVGPEAKIREAVAASLAQTASTLEGGRLADTLPTNPLLLFWQERVGRPVYQEVADIVATPGAEHVMAVVWWFDVEGGEALPLRIVFERNGSGWYVKSVRQGTGGKDQCTGWPTGFTINPAFAWLTSAS